MRGPLVLPFRGLLFYAGGHFYAFLPTRHDVPVNLEGAGKVKDMVEVMRCDFGSSVRGMWVWVWCQRWWM